MDATGSEILKCRRGKFATILADPPWPFFSKGRGSPENAEASYKTMSIADIAAMPVTKMVLPKAHLYLWVLHSQLEEGLEVARRWGFRVWTNLAWIKTRKDGGVDGGGMGNFFRHAHELCLFCTRGSARTRQAARSQPSVIMARRREHSRKPDELYGIIEKCSPSPRLELFARYPRRGWYQWGNQLRENLHTRSFDNIEQLPTTLVYTTSNKHVIYRNPIPKRKS